MIVHIERARERAQDDWVEGLFRKGSGGEGEEGGNYAEDQALVP